MISLHVCFHLGPSQYLDSVRHFIKTVKEKKFMLIHISILMKNVFIVRIKNRNMVTLYYSHVGWFPLYSNVTSNGLDWS